MAEQPQGLEVVKREIHRRPSHHTTMRITPTHQA